MGYIAPLTLFQYEQYNQSVIQSSKKREPAYVSPVHRPNETSKFLRTLEERLADSRNDNRKNLKKNNKVSKGLAQNYEEDKGVYINEYA